MNKQHAALLFYSGTLISSVGSLAFNVCLIAFMIQAGFNLGHASLIIGLQRLIPVIVTGIWGHFTDSLPARTTVIVCEIIAAVGSLLLLAVWQDADTTYPLLAFLCIARAVVVSFQLGSRTKLTKLLSDDSYSGNSKNAIWFNKATQGATLFSGLLAWFIIRNFDLKTAIIIDAVSFFISGVAVFLIPTESKEETAPCATMPSWMEKFRSLFQYNPRAAILDLLLAVSMMGTVAFMARMAGGDQAWTGKFMASYGLAVWVAGFLERKITAKIPSYPFWILLGLGFCILGFIAQPSLETLGIFFVKDLAYWVILHRISSYIQMDSPTKQIGAISSARMSIMIAILAIGEVLVGAWSNVVPLWTEGTVRALILLTVGIYLFFGKAIPAVTDDRPKL